MNELFSGINLYLILLLSPLVAASIAGIFGFVIGKRASHSITILGVLISTICAYTIFYQVQVNGLHFNGALYTWLDIANVKLSVGLLIDGLTSMMLVVVTSVSLMVHIYTIGYMAHEDGYQRFFSYISLFTFMMLMLVTSNNFMQLFFGWEGVGLVSYLLIGFYYKRESAIFANLKAFLINRIGDLGFLLGIGLVLAYFGTLDYVEVFNKLQSIVGVTFAGTNISLITLICVLLFVGAMGKSAQFPLHVWLPDSMEGPTPISALIHAATMVTAGIFMVARLSPMYNLSETALSIIIVAGGINCFFLGILGIIQNDIKRVVAYSTLSQLGYMAVALGCGAYSVAAFHLMTHAFFKGLLFLGAGSVIIAMHHEQDMRKMGGLAKYMPITYVTMIIGSLALAGIPPFAGFFSKDLIIESAMLAYKSGIPAGWFAVFAVYASVMITSIYSFRLIFMTFHGEERFKDIDHSHSDHHHSHDNTPHESPWVVTLPLIILAIPSVIAGWVYFGDFVSAHIFGGSVTNISWYVEHIQDESISPLQMILGSFVGLPVYLALLGILVAWIFHKNQHWGDKLVKILGPVYTMLENKYYMDDIYIKFLAPFGRRVGNLLYRFGDLAVIDGVIVNGSAKIVSMVSSIVRKIQTGYVNSSATYIVLGLLILLTFASLLIFN